MIPLRLVTLLFSLLSLLAQCQQQQPMAVNVHFLFQDTPINGRTYRVKVQLLENNVQVDAYDTCEAHPMNIKGVLLKAPQFHPASTYRVTAVVYDNQHSLVSDPIRMQTGADQTVAASFWYGYMPTQPPGCGS